MNRPALERLQSFAPVVPDGATRLILGSMPGVASLEAAQYYAHPRNAFWKILSAIYGGAVCTYPERLDLLAANNIALWDTLKYCERPGSLDSNIVASSIETNDFSALLQSMPTIELIAFNGRAAEKWFKKLVLPGLDALYDGSPLRFSSLPSSSPAMASLKLAEKTQLWKDALEGPYA